LKKTAKSATILGYLLSLVRNGGSKYQIGARRGALAQLVEQWPEEPRVVGSNPTGATKFTLQLCNQAKNETKPPGCLIFRKGETLYKLANTLQRIQQLA
jgi:hypothetical protein